ncbi:unnamed protein product [Phaedon cochleariae]|uniref:THAP-type domain-containing protein n=1 Tax=Phaedon cochleariae TaxID=80249 RepID=A0A9N9WY56_PHACE|nr:unnamed protein product [Phaedon cochleariae]
MAEVSKTVQYCCVCNKNSRHEKNISFFRFPKDERRFAEWKAILQLEKIASYSSQYCYDHFRICSFHFDEKMFASMQKNRLKKSAIPIQPAAVAPSVAPVIPVELLEGPSVSSNPVELEDVLESATTSHGYKSNEFNGVTHRERQHVELAFGEPLNPDNLITTIISSPEGWNEGYSFIRRVMERKEMEVRALPNRERR